MTAGPADRAGLTKTSRVHGTIQRTTRMLVFVARPDAVDKPAHRSPSPPFSLRRVNTAILIPHRVLPEPESRNGLSLARNSAFATIARSMFPTCAFDSTPQTFANPFDSDSFAPFGFEADTGRVIARYPFSAPISNAPDSSPASTPLWVFLKTLRIKVFDRFPIRSPSRETPDAVRSPPLLLSIPPRINA